MTDLTLESLRSELAQSLHSEQAPIRAQLESLHSEQAPIRAQLESLHSELAPTRAQLESLHSEQAPIRTQLESLHSEQAPIRAQLESLRSEQALIRAQLESLRSELAPIRAQLDGLPLINRALTLLQRDMRSLRVAFSVFARTHVTAGEVEALHFNVNRVQAENAELQSRLATVERLRSNNCRRNGPDDARLVQFGGSRNFMGGWRAWPTSRRNRAPRVHHADTRPDGPSPPRPKADQGLDQWRRGSAGCARSQATE